MKHVQFEHEGEIINAILSDCGLFCHESCENLIDNYKLRRDEYKKDTHSRFYCTADFWILTNYKDMAQALIWCQQAAQKVKP